MSDPTTPVNATPLTTDEARKAKKAAANRAYRARKAAAPAPDAAPAAPPAPAAGGEMQICLLVYDIPSKADVDNPSKALRRLGFRANLSCWVIPEGSLPLTLINDLRTKANASVDIIKFAPSENERLVKLAVRTIQKEVADQLARTRKSLKKTEGDYLTDSDIPSERDVAEVRFRGQVKDVFSRLETLVADVQEAIVGFGVDPKRLKLADVQSAYNGLQDEMAARCAAYAAATAALRGAGTETSLTLASEAAKDRVPAYVLSDALRDAGRDGDAEALDAAFRTPADDDGTFPLTGDDGAE